MVDRIVWSSDSVGRSRSVRTATPENSPASSAPVSAKVILALRGAGSLNACTPLEITSTPLNATAPDENARASRNGVITPSMTPLPVTVLRSAVFAGSGAMSPVESLTRPTMISALMPST